MESYVLSCCSTVDISKEWAEKRNILLAYFRFYLNEEEYRDDFYASLSQEKLFERMLNGEKSKTSQVNSEEYMTLFRPSLEAGKDIVVRLAAHVSNGLKSRIRPVVGRI